jgi:hypothetical protein
MKYDRENRAQIDNDKSRKLAGVLGFGAQQLYFIYRGSTDKRRGYYVLIGLVRNELGSDPLGGAVYVFGSTEWSGRGHTEMGGTIRTEISKSRDRAGIIPGGALQSDGKGYSLFPRSMAQNRGDLQRWAL